MKALRLRITGKVQGVWFRESMRLEAERRGVAGWVRNCADGSVEALVQGNAASVDALLEWARTGPPLAEVAHVDVQPGACAGDFTHFEKRN